MSSFKFQSTVNFTGIAGNPGEIKTIFVADVSTTILSAVADIEIAEGTAASASIYLAANGVATISGTVIHSGTINLNGTVGQNQVLTLTTTAMNAGDRLVYVSNEPSGHGLPVFGAVTVCFSQQPLPPGQGLFDRPPERPRPPRGVLYHRPLHT